MGRLNLLVLVAFALVALSAFAAPGAYAAESEESGNPRILTLEGKVTELSGTLKGGAGGVVELNGEEFEGTAATLALEKCKEGKGLPRDTNLCEDQKLTLTGVKENKVACRSENNKGEKDPVETVLSLLDLHVAAELTAAKVLQPVFLAKLLGTALEEEVKVICGIVDQSVKGVFVCLLLPGLENIPTTKEVEVLCKINEATHDPETGQCVTLCEVFGKIGVFILFDAVEIDSTVVLHLTGKLNKDVYIDD
jgi:hypothetical protein